jgi:hypothetical protein
MHGDVGHVAWGDYDFRDRASEKFIRRLRRVKQGKWDETTTAITDNKFDDVCFVSNSEGPGWIVHNAQYPVPPIGRVSVVELDPFDRARARTLVPAGQAVVSIRAAALGAGRGLTVFRHSDESPRPGYLLSAVTFTATEVSPMSTVGIDVPLHDEWHDFEVHANRHGQAIACWSTPLVYGEGSELWMNQFDGARWGQPTRLRVAGRLCEVAMTRGAVRDDGSAFITWLERGQHHDEPPPSVLWAAELRNGRLDDLRVLDDETGDVGKCVRDQTLVIGPRDDGFVFWTGRDEMNGPDVLKAQRFSREGGWAKTHEVVARGTDGYRLVHGKIPATIDARGVVTLVIDEHKDRTSRVLIRRFE